jgi:hypothetical protein
MSHSSWSRRGGDRADTPGGLAALGTGSSTNREALLTEAGIAWLLSAFVEFVAVEMR